MAYQIYAPGDFIPDPGNNGRVYPIEDEPDLTEIIYDKRTQKVSYITANMVAVFTEWFLSFFEGNYFKKIRIKTQSSFTEFKSFMKTIYKIEKPFIVIDPRPPEVDETSIFAQNMLNRYNFIDPEHDNIGAKLMYSLQIMGTDLFELWYRRNRVKIEFDVMIMESSTNRQTNTRNKLIMDIRHNSKFTLNRRVPFMIPMRHIQNIANFHGYDWKSDEFVKFMNEHSRYPIIKRIIANGQYQFYMEQDLHIYVESDGFPAADSTENAEAIEWGARVVDSFTLTADLPMEFLFLTKKEYVGKFDRGVPEDPDGVTFISPIYADLDWPKELNGYVLSNRIDIEVQEGDEPKLNILSVIADFDKDIYSVVKTWIDNKGKISDMMQVRVYPNGSRMETGAILHNDGMLELTAPQMNKLYTANIYLNLQTINLLREGANKKYAGTVQLD